MDDLAEKKLLAAGRSLEALTMAWNVAGVIVLALTALKARSVALGGFGLDSAVEIAASALVLYELRGSNPAQERRTLRLIGWAFIVLAVYLAGQSVVLLVANVHPAHSPLGLLWTGLTAVVMFALATAKYRVGDQLQSQVLMTESRVTFVDGLLATFVVAGLAANAVLGWWWADPASAFVIVAYSVRESIEALRLASAPIPEVTGGCGQACASCTNLCEADETRTAALD
jgi:divalent metal cation (Fe/Co/Zn/Cd) transporter